MSWSGVKKQTNVEDIKSWCEEMGIENYIINSKGEIDVDGDVMLVATTLKELPYKFGKVNGYFDVGNNKNLISLKNCPNEVEEYFACNLCKKLDSLEGCPEEVKENFWCSDCKRTFTREEVQSLCNVYNNIYNI